MGYYDQDFLNYYYYMASQFALSDRWFSPVASKSVDNRIATFTGGTTQGIVKDPGGDDHLPQLDIPTIFQALDQETALRVISSDPPSLARYFTPIFSRELLESAQILGLGLSLGNPVKGRLALKMKTQKAAEDLAEQVRSNPQRWLKMQDTDALLFAQPPDVVTQGQGVEIRFNPIPSSTVVLPESGRPTASTQGMSYRKLRPTAKFCKAFILW